MEEEKRVVCGFRVAFVPYLRRGVELAWFVCGLGPRCMRACWMAPSCAQPALVPASFFEGTGCDGSFGQFLAFWECRHWPPTQVERSEGDNFDDNLKSGVVIQVFAAVHVELLQLQLLEALGHCEVSETEQ